MPTRSASTRCSTSPWRPRATRTSTRTHRRGHRDHARSRRCARRSATSAGPPVRRRASCPWTRRWYSAIDVSGHPYFVHVDDPDAQAYHDRWGSAIRGLADPSRLRSLAFHAHIASREAGPSRPHTWWRPVQGRSPARCGFAVAPTRGWTGVPSTKGADPRAGMHRGGPRLGPRGPLVAARRAPALEPSGSYGPLTQMTASPPWPLDGLVVPGVGAFATCIAGCRAIRGPGSSGRLARRTPGAGHLRRHAGAVRAGVDRGVGTEGCGRVGESTPPVFERSPCLPVLMSLPHGGVRASP